MKLNADHIHSYLHAKHALTHLLCFVLKNVLTSPEGEWEDRPTLTAPLPPDKKALN